ncbi:MAG: DUF4249 domain-containing protein [Flavobacteriaceae bacterium]|nr:DUF4249 domain-containing protein [Flavobacteriaceae bacterium]
MKKFFYYTITTIAIVLLISACTESFQIEARDFDKALVVEASITDEDKYQEIKLTEAFRLDETSPKPITNAIVKVQGENNNTVDFKETTPGVYLSTVKFAAKVNVNYQLSITTSKGVVYESKPTKITSASKIDDVYVTLGKNIANEDEFSINVDSYDPNNKSKYYRYEYEETYKIEAPFWSPLEAVVINSNPKRVEIINKKDKTKKVCYQTNYSKGIIQTETSDLSEDRVTKFPVRKINAKDFIISHRYSILVKQYVQSFEAYTYYKILNKFSNASNILSQSQPGFFSSNISSTTDKDEKVLGFFEVSAVSEKRIFFNYRDFYDTGRPQYPEVCNTTAPENRNGPGGNDLVIHIESKQWLYFADNKNADDAYPGPYLLKPVGCGDCTKYGTNVKPSFWVD